MAKKKIAQKSKGKASSKRSQPKPKSKVKSAPEKKYVTSKTPRSVPKVLRPLKKSQTSRPAPSKPKERNFLKTKSFKQFSRQYKRRADKDYWKQIKKTWKELYDKKGQPVRIVKINIEKKYIRNTKNRLIETKKKYWGREKWRKGPDGKWKEGKAMKRNVYRDKLLGNYVKGRKVGIRFLKVMEKDLIRKYMKKHRIKNYNKAKKRFWKDAESKSIHTLIKLYGGSP